MYFPPLKRQNLCWCPRNPFTDGDDMKWCSRYGQQSHIKCRINTDSWSAASHCHAIWNNYSQLKDDWCLRNSTLDCELNVVLPFINRKSLSLPSLKKFVRGKSSHTLPFFHITVIIQRPLANKEKKKRTLLISMWILLDLLKIFCPFNISYVKWFLSI